MGDRTTPMKFGPEWLRNLSREPNSNPSAGGGAPITPPIRPVTSIGMGTNTSALPITSKVFLAKIRYGREEMLALYDRETAEAPPQLKSIDHLYQARGKPPYALNNNYEDDARDNSIRNNPPIGVMNVSDRYGQGRGRGISMSRGITVGESRGRARGFTRQTTLGRTPSWHNGGQRNYPGAPEDDPNPPRGLWNNGNGTTLPGIRPNTEQGDWATKMAYRKNRQNHTNWRQQQNREEAEEWRAQDGARRGQEKWEREWPERSQDKPWTTNRRQWGADNNEDALPEWAVENSEACGGTFDSSGAFHGYSNDDSNIPKAQDSSYQLARSHTHGNMKRFCKLRFDATEVKFKKPSDENVVDESGSPPTATHEGITNSVLTRDKPKLDNIKNMPAKDEPHEDSPELQDEAAALPAKREITRDDDKKDKVYQTNYLETPQASVQQRIDMLLRTEERDTSNDRGNLSVMMATNSNHLRQQHQNIGTPTAKIPIRFARLLNAKQASDEEKQQETKLIEDMLDMRLTDEVQAQILNSTAQTGIPNSVSPMANLSPGMQMRRNNLLMKQGMGINQQSSNTQTQPSETSMARPIGITNSMLNASLGLPLGTGSNMNMPMTSMQPPPIPNPGMLSSTLTGLGNNNMQMQGMQSGMQSSNLQVGGLQSGMQVPGMQTSSFQTGMAANMQTGGMNNPNLQAGFQVGASNNSLFMQGAPTNMQNTSDMSHGQQNMYPMHGHGLQQSASQGSFNAASLYGNMMQPPPINMSMSDQWYYEDPKKTIQGPFSSKDMYSWYRAGFFTPDLMVRRACEPGLMPLANYGLMPFGPNLEMHNTPYDHSGRYHDMRQQSETMLAAQQAGLGPEVESLWSQPSNVMWMQQPVTHQISNPRDVKNLVNNLSMYFWDQPTGMSNSLLPEGIPKEMKTEDEILAQIRSSQGDPAAQNLTFMSDAVSPEEAFTAGTNIAPNLEELQKLIGSDIHVSSSTEPPPHKLSTTVTTSAIPRPRTADSEKEKAIDKPAKTETAFEVTAKQQASKASEAKSAKQLAKAEEKAKVKEGTPKTKSKKSKDEKKEDSPDSKKDDDKKNNEKRLDEPSPPKSKREEKASKKELDKEKKEWLKDGFTLVKGPEKKDNKKKEKEEARAAEEAEKARKEEEKRALEAEKNKAPEPVTRRQQLEQGASQRQSQVIEQPPKKAPWSAQPGPAGRDGLALSDIQRLEREKKLEQMKEQQQMMQAIALQQAAAAQREQQEMQAGQVGWAKKKQPNNSPPGQSLAEIQAEARKQAAAMAAAAAAAREDAQPAPPPANVAPWGSTNGGGFWDSPSSSNTLSERNDERASAPQPAPARMPDVKPKKKVTVVSPPKKEPSPSADFEMWCSNVLSNWRDAANIDIPTFVAFLRDIESPYEVKDYVKCYLGDTKEANDFARQFLERRSRLLRVGMVTPSDDLCSPAAALTPRTNSGSDYTEVKSKTNQKTKKNKMLKIDARILGFSVTASEDRINIGDIDTV